MGSVDELDVLDRARRGDRYAFEQILRPLVEPAYRLALAMLHEKEAAEDAVQEMALKGGRRRGRLRPDVGAVRPRLLAIVPTERRLARRGRAGSVRRRAMPVD